MNVKIEFPFTQPINHTINDWLSHSLRCHSDKPVTSSNQLLCVEKICAEPVFSLSVIYHVQT